MFYKYYAAGGHGCSNLRDKIVCFSDIDKFNDPFEGVGEYLYRTSPEEQEFWNTIGSPDTPRLLGERFEMEARDYLTFKHRVWCVTKSQTNPLMWAHYASSHRGFCVGYREEDIRKICHKFEAVAYRSTPAPLSRDGDMDMDMVDGLLYQKSDAWAYEEEWRAVYTVSGSDVTHLDPFKYISYCFQYDKDYIYKLNGAASTGNLEVLCAPRLITRTCPPAEVYLGLRISSQDRKDLLKICEDQSIPAYQMYQASGSLDLSSRPLLPQRA